MEKLYEVTQNDGMRNCIWRFLGFWKCDIYFIYIILATKFFNSLLLILSQQK